MTKTYSLFLSGIVAASSAHALVADGSQAILTTSQFNSGQSYVVNSSSNETKAYREEVSGNNVTRIDVDAKKNQFGVLARAESTGAAQYMSASATYYEIVSFAAPEGGANITYSVSIDGVFTVPTIGSAQNNAWARGLLYAVDVTGRSPFRDYETGAFSVLDYGNNTSCVEINVIQDLAETISGCGFGKRSYVESTSQGRALTATTNSQLHVENGHRYLFISELKVSATAVGAQAIAEADLMHTFRLNVQSLGGASVLSANGPMFAASLVPEPGAVWLFASGLGAAFSLRRKRLSSERQAG